MHLFNYLLVPTVVSALAVNKRTDCDAPSPRALYMLDTNPNGSTVVGFSINVDDGSLSDQVVTPTGQLGLMGLLIDLADPVNGAPAIADNDPLYSQNAIIVHNDVSYLFIFDVDHPLINNPSTSSLSTLEVTLSPCSPLTQQIPPHQPSSTPHHLSVISLMLSPILQL